MYSKKIILSLAVAFLGTSLPTSAWAMDTPPLAPEKDKSNISVRPHAGPFAVYHFSADPSSEVIVVGQATLKQENLNQITLSEFKLFENTPCTKALEIKSHSDLRDVNQIPIAVSALNRGKEKGMEHAPTFTAEFGGYYLTKGPFANLSTDYILYETLKEKNNLRLLINVVNHATTNAKKETPVENESEEKPSFGFTLKPL